MSTRRLHLHPLLALVPLAVILGCPASGGSDSSTPLDDSTGEVDGTSSTGGASPTTSGPDDSTGSTGHEDLTVGTTGSTGSVGTSSEDTTGPLPDTSTGTSTDADSSTGTDADTDTTDGAGESETSGVPDDCGDLTDAPAPLVVDGVYAVPIDILSVTAESVLDYVQQSAVTRATMTFRLGPEGGHPIFDLRRQNFVSIKLDDAPLAEPDIAHRDLGGGAGAEMRVLMKDLPACSEHVLELEYPMQDNNGTDLMFLQWAPYYVHWDFGFSDYIPGRLLERWLPANLIYDRHPVTLTVEVLNSPAEHALQANGAVEPLGANKWKIAYPAHFTAMSPLIMLETVLRFEHSSEIVQPQGGAPVTVELYRHTGTSGPNAALHADLAQAFDEFTAISGPYPHASFISFVAGSGSGGTEYEGGTITGKGSLRQMLFLNWFGRGLTPRRSADGWLDAAWAPYIAESAWNPTLPLALADTPVELYSENPWRRQTHPEAEKFGRRLFFTLAGAVGEAELRLAMREFYEARAPGVFSTPELEQHLHCELQHPLVRDLFHRFVYGKAGPTPDVPPGYCP